MHKTSGAQLITLKPFNRPRGKKKKNTSDSIKNYFTSIEHASYTVLCDRKI